MAAAAALAIFGSALSAVGAIESGQAQANALLRAAEIQRNNAILEMESAEMNAVISSIKSDQRIGSIRAGYGASGISSDSGSALAVLAASTANAELDRQNIIHGAKVRAINYENQAHMDEIGAESAKTGSLFRAFGAVAQGGSQLYGQSAGSQPGSYTPTIGNAQAGPTNRYMGDE